MLRRSFIQSILALGVAPYVGKASALMPMSRPLQFVYGKVRLGCAFAASENIIEHTTTVGGELIFEYSAPLIHLAQCIDPQASPGRVVRAWADGQDFDISRFTETAYGQLTVRDLILSPYGNRVPNFSFEYETLQHRNAAIK